MLSIEGNLERRRRRGQNEINVLVREFSESGLSQKEFALKVGVYPLTVARWVESCAGKPLTDGPTSTSSVLRYNLSQMPAVRSGGASAVGQIVVGKLLTSATYALTEIDV